MTDTEAPSLLPRYRKKPVVIEAWQVQPNLGSCPDWLMAQLGNTVSMNSMGPIILIKTLEGEMTARPGDWVIKGVKGEFYPIKNDIFLQTYEAVDATYEPEATPPSLPEEIRELARELKDYYTNRIESCDYEIEKEKGTRSAFRGEKAQREKEQYQSIIRLCNAVLGEGK